MYGYIWMNAQLTWNSQHNARSRLYNAFNTDISILLHMLGIPMPCCNLLPTLRCGGAMSYVTLL
jgi:hypothetical protein